MSKLFNCIKANYYMLRVDWIVYTKPITKATLKQIEYWIDKTRAIYHAKD